jgi:hypothetical protein
MPRAKKPIIDKHTAQAAVVAKHSYFTIAEFSGNENPGLLVGTEVQKFSDPEPRQSKYWNGLYWTTVVICPNGETRKVSCDALRPRRTDLYFKRQQRMFGQVA